MHVLKRSVADRSRGMGHCDRSFNQQATLLSNYTEYVKRKRKEKKDKYTYIIWNYIDLRHFHIVDVDALVPEGGAHTKYLWTKPPLAF